MSLQPQILGVYHAADVSPERLRLATLHAIAPLPMHWDTGKWLLDFAPVATYWSRQLPPGEVDVTQPLRDRLPPETTLVWSHHPWHAALAMHQLDRASTRPRIVNARETIPDPSWEAWLAALERLDTWWARSPSERAGAARSRQHLTHIMGKLGVARPKACSRADSASMYRRFGKAVATAWAWTYPESCSQELAPFPWFGSSPQPLPTTTRDLDHPLDTWQHLAPLLRKDCELLQAHPNCDPTAKITGLDWELRVSPNLFLRRQLRYRLGVSWKSPDHPTLLASLQDELAATAQEIAVQGGTPNELLGWTLTVVGQSPQALERSLFATPCDESQARVLAELAGHLTQAQAPGHFRFDDSVSAPADRLFWRGARCRPLWLRSFPAAIAAPNRKQLEFTERVSTPWEETGEARPTYRDYYRHRCANGHVGWVFRDHNHQWYHHGDFC